MKDESLLQPLQDYIKPANSDLLALLPGPALLAVAVFLSGQEFPPILIWFMVAAAVFAFLGHFLQRRGGDRTVLEAAERYGETALAEDFRAARSLAGDQLRLGRTMLYSRFGQNLWALRELDSVTLKESTDSDGDKCLEIWCILRGNCGVTRIYYNSSTSGAPYLQSVCDLINQQIAAVRENRP